MAWFYQNIFYICLNLCVLSLGLFSLISGKVWGWNLEAYSKEDIEDFSKWIGIAYLMASACGFVALLSKHSSWFLIFELMAILSLVGVSWYGKRKAFTKTK